MPVISYIYYTIQFHFSLTDAAGDADRGENVLGDVSFVAFSFFPDFP